MKHIILKKSTRKGKKFMVIIDENAIHFGDSDYQDFTTHNDKDRLKNYLARHAKNEDWTIQGLYTAGFWSRWILWNQTSISKSIDNVSKRFNLKISMLT